MDFLCGDCFRPVKECEDNPCPAAIAYPSPALPEPTVWEKANAILNEWVRTG